MNNQTITNRPTKSSHYRLYLLLLPVMLFCYQKLSAGYCILPVAGQTETYGIKIVHSEDCYLIKTLLRIPS